MDKQTNDILRFNQLLTQNTLPYVKRFIDVRLKDNKRWIEAQLKRYAKLQQAIDATDELPHKVALQREYKQSLLKLLKEGQKQVDADKEDFIKGLNKLVKDETAVVNHTVRVKEMALPYTLSIKDNPIKSIRKIWSNIVLFFRRTAVAIANWGQRVIFRREVNRAVLRHRRIPYRNMCRYFLNVSLVEHCFLVFGSFFKGYSNTLLKLWEGDDDLDEQFQKLFYGDKPEKGDEGVQYPANLFNQALEGHNQIQLDIDEQFNLLAERIIDDFTKAIAKVDTIEMPRGLYRHAKVEKRSKELLVQSSQILALWQNTHRTLFDDWILDVEVTLFYYSVYGEFNLLYENVGKFSTNNLSELFAQIKALLSEIQSSVNSDKKSKKDML
ncbi:MAG: hypothetical protein PHW91_07145, partial [Bacteroidales bacterium]|nr:hypothetical protein [Bacteroidales bacterium]